MEGQKHLPSANTNNSSAPWERELCLFSLLLCSNSVHFRQKAILSDQYSFPFTLALSEMPLLLLKLPCSLKQIFFSALNYKLFLMYYRHIWKHPFYD